MGSFNSKIMLLLNENSPYGLAAQILGADNRTLVTPIKGMEEDMKSSLLTHILSSGGCHSNHKIFVETWCHVVISVNIHVFLWMRKIAVHVTLGYVIDMSCGVQ